jgi:hypothetical protein
MHVSDLHPIPYGAGVLLVPDWCCPPEPHGRVVKPALKIKGEVRRARV